MKKSRKIPSMAGKELSDLTLLTSKLRTTPMKSAWDGRVTIRSAS